VRIGFWLFMLAMNLIIPLTMLFFGKRFLNTAPGRINHFFGYRTQRSMKNRETWEFAHRCLGRYWLQAGKWTLIATVLTMAAVFDADMNAVSVVGTCVVCAQLIPMIMALPVTERALKQNFDAYGRRIEPK